MQNLIVELRRDISMHYEVGMQQPSQILQALPIPVCDLQEFLPHRQPMIWVDQVIEVGEARGACLTFLRRDQNYFSSQGFRRSAYFEMMAQSYGYVRACQAVFQIAGQRSVPKVAFLAQIRKGRILADLPPQADNLTITVELTKELGPLALVQAKVYWQELVLARAELKLYAE
jgi:3-hydroxyacyl-[acyl-carrier-protein] dehydratase